MKGKVILDVAKVETGMIRLGFRSNALYPNTGIIWENHGGTAIFRGRCHIANASAMSIGSNGFVDFGANIVIGPSMKLTSYCSITFGANTRLAWEVILLDTSFHKLKDLSGKPKGTTMAPISIGKNNWITTRCTVLKGSSTPDYCILGTGSILNKDYSKYPTHILLAGTPLEIKGTDIWRDIEDDQME